MEAEASPQEPAQPKAKRYVLLELTSDWVGLGPLHQWNWSRLLGVEARPLAISQHGGLADIEDALTHEC